MADPRLGTEQRPLRVAIVGSGPSAFYAAEALFKAEGMHVAVDMFDRLPTPFGLVRGGVAPDHQNIKAVVKVYDRIACQPGFRFFGHVTIPRDLSIDDLRAHYDRVVYAFGNESDRRLGIPGEDLRGIHSATEFVGWYNGHPDFRDRTFDLAHTTRVAVVGNGNVAMDVTRILVKDPGALADTDIADHALDVLRRSRVREVVLLGRRGPAQAAFSPKEIEEIGELEDVDLVVRPEDVELDPLSLASLEKAPRSARKNVDYLGERAAHGEGAHDKKVRCRFLVAPVEFLGASGRVRAVRVEHSVLEADRDGTPRPRGTGTFEEIPVELVLKAVGYRGVPIAGVPFDERAGVVPNDCGRVLAKAGGGVVPREYVVGWAKRGPTGLIGTNSPCSKETVKVMLEDLATLQGIDDASGGPAAAADRDAVPRLLAARGVPFVTFEDWRRLDEFETSEGGRSGRVRRKLSTIDDMLRVVREPRGAS
jgi:ferredoxin--NADP+ reductase